MRSKLPDPEKLILTLTISYILSASFRGYIFYRQTRLTALYGEFDTMTINDAADYSDFIDSCF